MPETPEQNLPLLNQENIDPNVQKQVGRVLAQPTISQASTAAAPPANTENAPQDLKSPGEQQNAKKYMDKVLQRAEKPIDLTEKLTSKLGAGAQASIKAVIGFSYPIWLTAIILAGIYDLYNICAFEFFSEFDWIADLILGTGITILLWTQGSKARQSKKILEQIVTTAAEIIPGIGYLPLWIIMVLWQFYKAYNEHEAEILQQNLEAKSQAQEQLTEEFA